MGNSNSITTTNKIILLLLFFLLAGLVAWGYSQIEIRTEEVDEGFQGEALTNEYLAAEYFLRSMGQTAERISLFIETGKPLGVNDTLLVPSNRIAIDRRHSEELVEWVMEGGHLIITGAATQSDTPGRRDYILDDLGISVMRVELDEDEDDEENFDDLPADLDMLDEDNFWQVNFNRFKELRLANDFTTDLTAGVVAPQITYETVWSVVDNGRVYAVQLKLGQGHITVLSDMSMFNNVNIDHYDHAAFLYSLTNVQAGFSEPGTFYYSLYEEQISLIQWLWDNAWTLVVSLLIAIVSGLWMIIPRFGPVININEPIRRRFLDHLAASGNYHWRQGNYAHLLNEVRKQLSNYALLKYPEWRSLSKNDQLHHFAELTQLEVAVVENALFDTTVEHVNDFVNKIKILEKLRKSL
ncbi:MAG TPA: DUF4350 domain-containing protein [Gammaproteobacteria bacterium]|nr:DUF4350 domain-containing protein [Gammaproteobacteria bacterium]